MNVISLMVFDHDMTIVDSSYSIMGAFNYVARHEGLPEVSHELTMKYIATPLPTFCEGLLGDYRPEWVKLYREFSALHEGELIRPFDDTVPTLKALHERGIKLAVLSNREYPRSVLDNTGLSKYFDEIVGAMEPYGKMPYKPNPAMMNELLMHMNIPADECVYVGDADIDIVTAEASKVRSIGISKGNFTKEDFMLLGAWKAIDTLSELTDIADADN